MKIDAAEKSNKYLCHKASICSAPLDKWTPASRNINKDWKT